MRHRSDDIPSACTDGLRTKQQIFIAVVADIESRGSSPSYSIEIVEALRGALPVVTEDANGRIPMVMSSHSGCNAPSLRRGQKVAVFLDSGVEFEGSTLQLTSSDVIMPYNRRLVGKLNRFLNQLDETYANP